MIDRYTLKTRCARYLICIVIDPNDIDEYEDTEIAEESKASNLEGAQTKISNGIIQHITENSNSSRKITVLVSFNINMRPDEDEVHKSRPELRVTIAGLPQKETTVHQNAFLGEVRKTLYLLNTRSNIQRFLIRVIHVSTVGLLII